MIWADLVPDRDPEPPDTWWNDEFDEELDEYGEYIGGDD